MFGAAEAAKFQPPKPVRDVSPPPAKPFEKPHPNKGTTDMFGADAIKAQTKPKEPEAVTVVSVDTSAVKQQISELAVTIAALIDEIDNNYNLSTIKVKEKRREVNHLSS